MASEKELSDQLKTYADLGKQDKNIDVTGLVLNALENQRSTTVSSGQKKWAYMISVGLPPLGLLWALKFYFGDEDDAKTVALICVLLTVVSGIAFLLTMKLFFSGAGVDPKQIEQIKPQEIIDLTK